MPLRSVPHFREFGVEQTAERMYLEAMKLKYVSHSVSEKRIGERRGEVGRDEREEER